MLNIAHTVTEQALITLKQFTYYYHYICLQRYICTVFFSFFLFAAFAYIQCTHTVYLSFYISINVVSIYLSIYLSLNIFTYLFLSFSPQWMDRNYKTLICPLPVHAIQTFSIYKIYKQKKTYITHKKCIK